MSRFTIVCVVWISILLDYSALGSGGTTLARRSPRQVTPCVEIYDLLSAAGLRLYEHGRELNRNEIAASVGNVAQISENSRVFLLGVGSNARVYRVEPRSGRTYVIKVYENMDRNRTDPAEIRADVEANYSRDRDSLAIYQRASRMRPPTATLEVISVERAIDENHTLKMGDVRGHIFTQVLNLARGTPRYELLVAEYNRRLETFVADLRTQGMQTERSIDDPSLPGLHHYHTRINGEALSVGLAQNTVYDPQTGRFVIIDPF